LAYCCSDDGCDGHVFLVDVILGFCGRYLKEGKNHVMSMSGIKVKTGTKVKISMKTGSEMKVEIRMKIVGSGIGERSG